MKKKLLIALVVVSLLVCVLAACGKQCEHAWVEGTTTATCETAGQTPMTCSLCGATTQKTAAALGHKWEFKETIAATCAAGGYDIYECSTCQATENRNETRPDYSAAGHDYKPVEVAPTCTTAGYTDNVCTICGNGDGNRVTIPKLGHTYERADFDGIDGFVPTEPTCTVDGFITYNCTADGCDASKVITYEDMVANSDPLAENYAKLGHDFTEFVDFADPTCTVAGYVINACANGCGETLKEATDPALGHSYERADATEADFVYKVLLNPTCITVGYEWVVCTVDDCGFCTEEAADKNEEYIAAYRREIAPTGAHVFDINVETVAPVCTADGYTIYGCSADSGCVATENRDFVTMLGHDMVLTESLLTNGVPTCLTDGNYPYNCTRCDYTAINLNGEENNGARHLGYTQGEYKAAPTCITRGVYFCTNCERDFFAYDEDTAAMPHGNHVYDVTGETTYPTCSTYGFTTYGCSADANCVATQDRDYVARTPHTFSAPTEDGTIVCESCSATYINETTVIDTKDYKLCTHAEGETCDTCGIGVVITGTKTPDAPDALTADTAFTKEFEKGAALIEFKGDVGTTYTITVNGKDGAITTYDVVDDGTDIGVINVVTTASGTCFVDLTEIANDVASITITASTAATVSFYVVK